MEIKLIDAIENPEKCIALKRIPHYALIKGIPCVLLSSVTSANEKALYRSIQETLIEADEQVDYVTADLMTQLSKWCEFNSWFLASIVGEDAESNI